MDRNDMPFRLDSKRNIAGLFIAVGIPFMFGCWGHNSLPKDWVKDVPGVYEGTSSSYTELVDFGADGRFSHELFQSGNKILTETGTWSISPGRYEIQITPAKTFTQFYDPVTRKFSTTGKEFGSYVYWPLPDGKTFSKISASVEFEYCLTRKK